MGKNVKMRDILDSSALTTSQLCWLYLKPHTKLIGGSIVFLLIAALTVLSAGYGLRYVIDHIATVHASNYNHIFYLSLSGIAVLAIAAFGRIMLTGQLGEKIVNDIRLRLFEHIVFFDRSLYEQQALGDLMSRLHQDTHHIYTFISTSGAVTMRSLIQLIGGTILLTSTSLKLTGLVFLIIPIIILPISLLGRKIRYYSHAAQSALGKVEAYSAEVFNALSDVQLFQNEIQVSQMFQKFNEQRWPILHKRLLMRSLLITIVIACAFSAISSVIWMGITDVMKGELSAGALTSFLFYALVVGGSLNQIAELFGDFQAARGACDRIAELLKLQPKIMPRIKYTHSKKIDLFTTLSINNVSFAYPMSPTNLAIHDVTFNLYKGQKIALVGSSGSGKTTLFRLLTRLYDPLQGSITIDGISLLDIDVSETRQFFSNVSQEPVLFNASIYDNIAFGQTQACEHDIFNAAHYAAVDEFSQHLPNKLNTIIGEQGFRLSGGQKQRIALARAFLRKAPILLMDEATNALDAHNELHIQQSLNHLMHDKTALIIAHRLATVKKADLILVLENGRIVQSGTHEELMSVQGTYLTLAELQYFNDDSTQKKKANIQMNTQL